MIWDCFSFFNELDLLEMRLHELHDVVDMFVLVEATLTHSGKPKPLYYQENHQRFAEFSNQIISVIVDDMPVTKDEIRNAISPQDRKWIESGYQIEDNWVRERYQRNAMMRVLKDCSPEDIIIIEDADEMVRKSILETIETDIIDGSNAVEQTLHTYYLNWKCTNMPWWGSKILRKQFVDNPSEHRFHTPAARGILNGGWHFNFLGGADAVKNKIISYAHQEFNVPEVLENVDVRLRSQKDALGRLYQYEVVEIDETYPQYIQDNLGQFRKWIYEV